MDKIETEYTGKKFPVLFEAKILFFPRFIPWGFVEKYRKRIETNHGQTIEKLASRGGLSVYEIILAANDLSFRGHEKISHEKKRQNELLWCLLYRDGFLRFLDENKKKDKDPVL